MRHQGDGAEGSGRMWRRIIEIAQVRVRRTVTALLYQRITGRRTSTTRYERKEFAPGFLPRVSSLILHIATARVDPQESYIGTMEYPINPDLQCSGSIHMTS